MMLILRIFFLGIFVSQSLGNLQCDLYRENAQCDISNVRVNKSDTLDLTYTNPEFVTKLWIYESTVQRLGVQIFNVFSHLKEFVAIDIQLQSIESAAFHNAKSLEILDLRYNNISKLGKRQFEGASHLKELHLFGNQLISIHQSAFHGLKNLKSLYLGKNHLKSLNPGVFSHLTNLEILSLEANYFSTLKANVFRGLRNLKSLYLYSNSLDALDIRQMLTFMPALKEISLHDNEFPCNALKVYLNVLKGKDVAVTAFSEFRRSRKNKVSTYNGIECLNVEQLEIKKAFGGNEKLYMKSHAGLNWLM